jgi:hypothetical protein
MTACRYIALVLFISLLLPSCEKNTVSKIPQISLITFYPLDSMRVNIDTSFIYFSLIDGDADIGNSDSVSGIFLKDSRDSGGFMRFPFPFISPPEIEDPKKGLEGKCLLYPVPQPVPRSDSIHVATGDTLYYQLYITDRAGHHSDTITTNTFFVRP